MKYGFSFLILTFFALSNSFSQSPSDIDVTHYKFNITLSDNDDTLQGNAYITFIPKESVPLIEFDLVGIGQKGKGMIVTSVQYVQPGAQPPHFTQEKDKIIIAAGKYVIAGKAITVVINYKGIPSDGLIISKNKYGDRTFFADNWPNRAHNWIPCKDEPDDKASFEFIVTAPLQYAVISNGKKTEEKNIEPGKKLTHWIEDVSLSTKVMVIGVAEFAVKQFADSPPGIPVSAWVYPQDSVTGFRNYSVAPGILKFLSDYIAPYPYNKLANVQSKTIFGGMENASCIFYEESTASSRQTVESLLAHEITHQWFGDMASEKTFAHLWLSEGFATYFTHIYIESKYGTDSMNHEMETDRNQIIDFDNHSDRAVVDSVSSLMRLLNPNSYQKGGWVLHMLHRELGDTIFHQIIQAYYEKYKGGNADTRDFEAVAEKISGKNLDSFFNQWLYTPGVPHLKISWKYVENENKVDITVEQIQQTRIYEFPLDLKIKTSSNEDILNSLNVNQKIKIFSFPVKSRPVSFTVDPFTSLLYEGEVNEIK